MRFSVIPRLLRYSLRLRARSHNFSGELCSALLVFPTHFLLCPSLPLFSNICRSSVQQYCTSNTVVFDFLLQTNHNIYLTVLLSLKFIFTQWGTFLGIFDCCLWRLWVCSLLPHALDFSLQFMTSNFSLGGAYNILIIKFSSSLLLKCGENG